MTVPSHCSGRSWVDDRNARTRSASRATLRLASSSTARAEAGSPGSKSSRRPPRSTGRHGRSLPRGSAGSMKPALASDRRWKEQFATVSPVVRAHSVAVASPTSSRWARRSRRRGCARARILAGSVIVRCSSATPPP
ncbi:hypothetical protein N869_09340 [Cellulomonas bogoriensis 69B4 = DSM 16987]|uniref:Uncharacterized protein n=1 Tax=Cellulomonas bogoriensis 69B4 = DSM 16987 TaxID=1386082 RepID=A0A0A0C0Y6_9CELL|nr:hypothetical protein N869_09340 [Cellulomonas bogoriensis 69B4 = DSM 16987]